MFVKYAKIPDRSSDGHSVRKEIYVVSEKVHGANFSITALVDEHRHTVSFAKRSGIIGPEEDFFFCRSSGLTTHLERLVEVLVNQLQSVASVVVFGEVDAF